VLESKAISHSLTGFSFSKDAFSFDDTTALFKDSSGSSAIDDGDDDFGAADAFGGENDGALPPAEDFFVGADAAADDYGGDMFGGDDGAGDGNENDSSGGQDDQRGETRPAQFVPFDPRRMPTERDLIMAMTDAGGDGGTMDYFDQNFLKNWAGPEHWKLRKVIRKRESFSF
jgi:condensin complex subunit 2